MRMFSGIARVVLAFAMAASLVFSPVLGALSIPTAHAGLASALTFTGSNYVQVANNASLSIPTSLTIEAWIKPSTVTGFQDVVGKTGYELGVQQVGSGFQAQFQLRIAGGWYTATTPSSAPLAVNRWYRSPVKHVHVVHGGGEGKGGYGRKWWLNHAPVAMAALFDLTPDTHPAIDRKMSSCTGVTDSARIPKGTPR